MTAPRTILAAYVVLHAVGSAFSLAGFLLFPETVVDLVPDRVALGDVRHLLALFAVLPATFVAWDILFLVGLRAGLAQSLAIGFVAGSAGVLGAAIHLAFGRFGFAAADGFMGVGYLALSAWNWRTWAPSEAPRPAGTRTVRATRVVPAPNDAVWRVLGDFGTEHLWSGMLTRCERDTPDVRVGTVRVCTLPRPVMGRTEARERLVEFEPGLALAYELDGPAGPFISAGSRWSTRVDEAGRTEITVEGRFEPKNALVGIVVWPVMRFYVRGLITRTLAEFDMYLSTKGAAPAS